MEEMGLLLLLALSLLFAVAAPSAQELPASCYSNVAEGDKLRHHNASSAHGNGVIHLQLHHPRSPCSPAPLPPLPFSTFLRHDAGRAHSLSTRVHNKNAQPPAEHEMISSPLTPGASFGVGNYITRVSLGTPPVSYAMVVDTGSSLTWLQCQPCNISCHQQVGPIFDPSASSTYAGVPCSAPDCSSLPDATLNPSGCSPKKVCLYEASYGDSSFSVGYLSRDTLRLGSSLSIPSFIYGCGQDNEGLFGRSAGLIGLAKNRLSLLSQAASKAGALAFAYCLPTAAGGAGSLSLGPYSPAKFSFTPMVTSSLDSTLYFIKLTSMSINGRPLPISSASYNTPTIIDSGTVITRLPSDVYSALSEAIATALKRYKRAEAFSILDTCFVGSVNKIAPLEVAMVFAGGATMKLSAKNVLIDVTTKTTCLAFAPATRGVAIIGNRQQQTFDVVYDVAEKKIGFAAGGCS